MKKLVLCMIVKNEERVLPRLFDSVRPYIDGWVICDTGSTDSTHSLCAKWAEEAKPPGYMASHKWKNFGWNRSASFWETRAWVKKQGWNLSECYALLLDADMMFRIKDGSTKEDLMNVLTHAGHQMEQVQGGMRYGNFRYLRLDCPWTCIGSTHEYWNLDLTTEKSREWQKMMEGDDSAHWKEAWAEGNRGRDIDWGTVTLTWIDDVSDGGAKADKFERDRRFLEEEVKEDPKNPRPWFYLGQTYQDLGMFTDAIRCYEQRAILGGWQEEAWMALYRISHCRHHIYNKRKDEAKAKNEPYATEAEDKEAFLTSCLVAYHSRPSRTEPLILGARFLRKLGSSKEAWQWTEMARIVPYPHGDALFVETACYSDALWEERSISGFYAGTEDSKVQAGLACEWLFEMKNCPSSGDSNGSFRQHQAMQNRMFYPFSKMCQKREGTRDWQTKTIRLGDKVRVHTDHTGEEITWAPMNPAWVNYKGKDWYGIRLVNYKIRPDGSYEMGHRDGRVRTHYLITTQDVMKEVITDGARLDDTRIVIRPSKGGESRKELGKDIPHVLGLEDQRWIVYQGRVHFLATCAHIPGWEGIPRIVMGRYNENMTAVEDVVHMVVTGYVGRDIMSVEKNWLPFVHPVTGKLCAVIDWCPFRLAELDIETGEAKIYLQRDVNQANTYTWRGSTVPTAIPNYALQVGNFPGEYLVQGMSGMKLADEKEGKIAQWFGCMIHEVIYDGGNKRRYWNRWVEFEPVHGSIRYYSRPFWMNHGYIEFPMVCAIRRREESPLETEWFVMWGDHDATAYVLNGVDPAFRKEIERVEPNRDYQK